MQLWLRTALYAALGCTGLGALAGIVAADAVAVQLPRDGAGRTTKGSCNLSNGELLEMETGQGHTLFGLDLFVVLEWSDLHLRTLQGWQVLHFAFESAVNKIKIHKSFILIIN